jgi:hypothetical protein
MRVLKWAGIALGVLVVFLFGTVSYLKSSAKARYATRHDVEVAGLPIPFPLSEHELNELRKEQTKAPEAGPSLTGDAAVEPSPAQASAGDALAGMDLSALAQKRALARGKHYLTSRALPRVPW